ncbi:MAG: serine/threonine protein kinase, partial [Clostridia bacterium]|nr:serine/threonine protein kinase [Clostridia bacterium]
IDAIPYNKKYTSVTWETCTLRKWMNSDFISKAFSSSQQTQIATVTNQNPNNPEYGTKGGNATKDKIFALSIDEAKKYFRDDDDRMAAPTGYAKKKGCYVSVKYSLSTGEKTGWWWLRSPGLGSNGAAIVDLGGGISQSGIDVGNNGGCVRPAFWLNL